MNAKKNQDFVSELMELMAKERKTYRGEVMRLTMLLHILQGHENLTSLAEALLAENDDPTAVLDGARQRIHAFLTEASKRVEAVKALHGNKGGN